MSYLVIRAVVLLSAIPHVCGGLSVLNVLLYCQVFPSMFAIVRGGKALCVDVVTELVRFAIPSPFPPLSPWYIDSHGKPLAINEALSWTRMKCTQTHHTPS